MTAYDALLGRRTVALGVALGALFFLAMMGTDDAASSHFGRLGRLAALASIAGGGAAFLAVSQARSRGELRALSATGTTPLRASLGALVGGALVGLLGAALVFVPGVDLAPLFPHALPAEAGWVRDSGGWLDAARGVRIAVDGAVSRIVPSGTGNLAMGRAIPVVPTSVALGVASFAMPLWATAREPAVRRALVCFAVASAAVFVFHLVAAERTPAMMLVFPPLLLLADAVVLHRGTTWS